MPNRMSMRHRIRMVRRNLLFSFEGSLCPAYAGFGCRYGAEVRATSETEAKTPVSATLCPPITSQGSRPITAAGVGSMQAGT